jgi:HK97 gp10 family phage protein
MAKYAKVTLSGSFTGGSARTRTALSRLVLETAFEVETEAKLLIQNPPKSGRIYTRGDKVHQASAPGQAPATDTGNLVNSIETSRKSDYEAIVAVNAEYAAGLEYGTAHILPRPFLRPAVEKQRGPFQQKIKDLIK